MEDVFPVGFAAFDPVPGLPHIADFYLFVLPSGRGAGIGQKLLDYVSKKAKSAEIKQLSTFSENPRSELARYLRSRDFYEEHVEIVLSYEVPSWTRPTLTELVTFPPEQAAALMHQLYDASFQDTPWYQPYADTSEILESIQSGSEVYFLMHEGEPIGFTSANIEDGVVEIEPLGIVRAHHGQGFGRKMMEALLYQFAKDGISEVRLAVWASNLPALTLYESIGFQGVNTRTFLAKDL